MVASALALAVGAGFACNSIADLDVTYQPCVQKPPTNNVEGFEAEAGAPFSSKQIKSDLLDRCWKEDGLEPNTTFFIQEGDFIVRPTSGQRWDKSTGQQGPIFYQSLKGDFVIVTQAEPASTRQTDHCLADDEGAGLMVRRTVKSATMWSTFLIYPYFKPDAGVTREVACEDDPTVPPNARAVASSYGFGLADKESPEAVDIGADSEALIALCRQDDQLAYYFYDTRSVQGGTEPPKWKLLHRLLVGSAPLDVGATVTSTASPAIATSKSSEMEGHFTWIYIKQLDEPVADGCGGFFEKFVIPEPTPK